MDALARSGVKIRDPEQPPTKFHSFAVVEADREERKKALERSEKRDLPVNVGTGGEVLLKLLSVDHF